jgi:hypothetical protein
LSQPIFISLYPPSKERVKNPELAFFSQPGTHDESTQVVRYERRAKKCKKSSKAGDFLNARTCLFSEMMKRLTAGDAGARRLMEGENTRAHLV